MRVGCVCVFADSYREEPTLGNPGHDDVQQSLITTSSSLSKSSQVEKKVHGNSLNLTMMECLK